MLKEYINNREKLREISLQKNLRGVATKKALRAQEKLYAKRIAVRKNFYDDYTGAPINDDTEIEALSDFIESILHLTSHYEEF